MTEQRKLRICIDLDGTICDIRKDGETYADVRAKPGAAEKIRALRAESVAPIIDGELDPIKNVSARARQQPNSSLPCARISFPGCRSIPNPSSRPAIKSTSSVAMRSTLSARIPWTRTT